MMDSKKWRERIPNVEKIHEELNIKPKKSDIILDGGAIELFGDQGIISDRVFRDNKMFALKSELDLIEKIKDKLSLKKIIVVPQFPYDFTGHVDGLVRFIDDNRILINELSSELSGAQKDIKERNNVYRARLIEQWTYSFRSALMNAGLVIEELTYTADRNTNAKDATGIYLNFLKLDNLIIMPTYNDPPNDHKAEEILRRVYHKEVITIYSTDLAKEGGVINCVTWTC